MSVTKLRPIDGAVEWVLDERNNPTEADRSSPEFKAIWAAIQSWDIQRAPDRGYAGANGSDVMTILNALRALEQETAE